MSPKRLRVAVYGTVQGVGFRPFVYRLATGLGLVGWIHNSAQGVVIEVEGTRSQLERFCHQLQSERPPISHIERIEPTWLTPVGDAAFEIRPSTMGTKAAVVLPDIATCSDCLAEIVNPTNRRYRYPFTNCTNCGPRFSLTEAIPYDRVNTTMRHFTMCPYCQTEYANPGDRRFHAQPNACPECGPHVELWSPAGTVLAAADSALKAAAAAIRQGKIVAIKGLGGFHLLVDARNELAVRRLRQAKQRQAKPFALMYPSLAAITAQCDVSELEAQLLRSPAAPIVLLKRRPPADSTTDPPELAPAVAPNTPYLGIMLPYTPLHHILLADLGFPVVATSGNLADEPICTTADTALQRLDSVADVFLMHNRAIAHPVDDSVARVLAGRVSILRRARGYAPLPIAISRQISRQVSAVSHQPGQHDSQRPSADSVLAVGGQLKNTIALNVAQQIVLSQHIGNLETVPAVEAFQRTIARVQHLYEQQPLAVACDFHPDYQSTQFAYQFAAQHHIPVIPVQHHYAHTLACMAENQIEGPVLGVAWDGTGYGLDGTVWGGEFLYIADGAFQRVAHLRPFGLPGGEKAVKEPRRSAIGLLYKLLGNDLFEPVMVNGDAALLPMQAFSPQERTIIKTMLCNHLQVSITSSMGRLFDAIASIIGLRQFTEFEGQAAMDLEFIVQSISTTAVYPFAPLDDSAMDTAQPMVLDWGAMVRAILTDQRSGRPTPEIAAAFHNTLVEMIVAVAKQVGVVRVVLTGGCFQNKYLIESAIQRLRAEDFQPYWHQHIPPNDGGIALGQLVAALRARSGGNHVFSCSGQNYQYQ